MKLLFITYAFEFVLYIQCKYIEVENVYQWREEERGRNSEFEEVTIGNLSTLDRGVMGEVSFLGEIYLKIRNFTFQGIF